MLFYACVVIACTALFVFCTNQFHKWAHTKNPAAWVRLLQRAGLILSPEHHSFITPRRATSTTASRSAG